MTGHRKSERLSPRFSLRFVLIALTLSCAYLSCWGPTENFGLRDVENQVFWRGARPNHKRIVGINATAVLPLIVGMDLNVASTTKVGGVPVAISRRCYYLWCFGAVAKLPLEFTNPDDENHWSRVVRTGMTESEITALLGSPDEIENNAWSYSSIGVFLFDEGGRVSEIVDSTFAEDCQISR